MLGRSDFECKFTFSPVFPNRMNRALEWIRMLNATFGKSSVRKCRTNARWYSHPTGRAGFGSVSSLRVHRGLWRGPLCLVCGVLFFFYTFSTQVSWLAFQHGRMRSPLYQAGNYGEWEFSVHWLVAAYQEQVSKMYLFLSYWMAYGVSNLQLWGLRTRDLC